MKLIPLNTEVQSDKAFIALPINLQNFVFARLRAVREIHNAPNTSRAVSVIAARYGHARGWTEGTIRNFYYNMLRQRDWRVLLDYARAGWKRKVLLNQPELSPEFCQWLGSKWSHRQRGKFLSAYVDLKAQYRRWRSGHADAAIPGYGACPPARPDTCLPPGWSEGNLRRIAKQNASHAARKMINIGPKATRAEFGYKLPATREGREVGEIIMPDDVKNDFKVLWKGKGSELWSLHILDYASGCSVMHGDKPTQEGDDFVKEHLKEADILFLVGSYMSNIGYRPAGTTFFCERASATIRPDDADALDNMTDGAILVKISPRGGGPGVDGLFAGRNAGLPTWKASLESFFNLLHNRCDDMLEFPGQTGSNSRLNKPEGLALMQSTDEALAKAIQIFTPEIQKLIQFNMLQCRTACGALAARIEFCNQRRDHNLEGWDECGNIVPAFRLHDSMDFIPFSKTDGMAPDQLEQLRRLLATQPNLIGEVSLSPREVFDAGAKKLRRFTLAQTASWLARVEDEKYCKDRPVKQGVIEFACDEINPHAPVVFGPTIRDAEGREETLHGDSKYLVRVNTYDPRVAWLYDARGVFQGVSRRQSPRADRTNPDTMQEHFKAAARVQSGYLREARQLAAPITQRAVDILDNNNRVISQHLDAEAALAADGDAATQ